MLLRTADVVSDVVPSWIGMSLAGYLIVYAALLISYIAVLFYLARKGGSSEDKTKMVVGAAEPAQGEA